MVRLYKNQKKKQMTLKDYIIKPELINNLWQITIKHKTNIIQVVHRTIPKFLTQSEAIKYAQKFIKNEL